MPSPQATDGGPAPFAPLPAVLESAWRAYRTRFLPLYLIASAAMLAAWIVQLVVRAGTIGGVPLGALDDPRAPELIRLLARVFGAGVTEGMVYAVANGLASAVITVLVTRREPGSPEGEVAEALRRAAPRFGAVLGATLLFFLTMAGFIVLTGLFLGAMVALGVLAREIGGRLALIAATVVGGAVTALVLPMCALGILLIALRWALYPQVAVLEGAGPMHALRRSARLTRFVPGRRLTQQYLFRAAVLLIALVVMQMAVGVVGAIPEIGAGLLYRQMSDPAEVSILNPYGMPIPLLIPLEIFSLLVSATVLPFGVVLFVLLYLELRPEAAAMAGAPAG